MAIPFTTEINPRGSSPEERQEDLIRQLRIQNQQLKIIIADIYKQIEGGKN
jgi:hypothetical protein